MEVPNAVQTSQEGKEAALLSEKRVVGHQNPSREDGGLVDLCYKFRYMYTLHGLVQVLYVIRHSDTPKC